MLYSWGRRIWSGGRRLGYPKREKTDVIISDGKKQDLIK